MKKYQEMLMEVVIFQEDVVRTSIGNDVGDDVFPEY